MANGTILGMNPEDRRARKIANSKAWYQKNQDRVRAYREATKEQRNARRRERYAQDPEHRAKTVAQVKKWHLAHPDVKKRGRLKKFQITLEIYRDILELQEYACAICRYSDMSDPNFFPLVDHDHETGAVRGLICMNCNQGLGKFQDDVFLLGKAITYLSKSHG